MRKIQEPFTMRKHGKIQDEINEFIIAIKLYHTFPPERQRNIVNWQKAMATRLEPKWDDMIEFLIKVRNEMSDCRIDPKKY